MFVIGMNDSEILREFHLEQIDGKGIVWKLGYYVDKFLKSATKRNNLFEKLKREGKLTYDGRLRPNVFIPIDPINIRTNRNNEAVCINICRRLVEKMNEKDFIQAAFFKIPVEYMYKSEKGKEAIKRGGVQYFQLKISGEAPSKDVPQRDCLLRITSHFLDRLQQRSKVFQERINMGLTTIQAYASMDHEVEGPLCVTEKFQNELREYDDDYILTHCDSVEVARNCLMIKRGTAFKKFVDGYVVYSVGIDDKIIPTYITFLTKEQLSDEELTDAEFESCFLDILEKKYGQTK